MPVEPAFRAARRELVNLLQLRIWNLITYQGGTVLILLSKDTQGEEPIQKGLG
jgi:hypothetical protein